MELLYFLFAVLGIVLVTFLIKIIVDFVSASDTIAYFNRQMELDEGREKKHWKRMKRRLFWSILSPKNLLHGFSTDKTSKEKWHHHIRTEDSDIKRSSSKNKNSHYRGDSHKI